MWLSQSDLSRENRGSKKSTGTVCAVWHIFESRKRTMRSGRHSKMLNAVAFLVLATWPALAQTLPSGTAKPRPAAATAPAAAPKGDEFSAIHKRFQDLYAARNYPEALIEAQKYETAVKAQLGTNH